MPGMANKFQGGRIQLSPQPLRAIQPPAGLSTATTVCIGKHTVSLDADELELVCELGRGAYGDVHKMREKKTGAELAVKRIRYTMNTVEQQRTAMDLDVAMRSLDCPYTVHFYGAMFRDGDVWICMEVMDTCLDRLYKRVKAQGNSVLESELAQVAFSIVSALHYLHRQLKVIHRDVKPSNILADKKGSVKLCDFGILAYLIDSIAKTRDAGTSGYLAPERIDPEGGSSPTYTVKADVWSLGITMMEVAEGSFPYQAWHTPFEQLRLVVEGPAPAPTPGKFSPKFTQFLNICLQKSVEERAGYDDLLQHPFILEREDNVDIGGLVHRAMLE